MDSKKEEEEKEWKKKKKKNEEKKIKRIPEADRKISKSLRISCA